MELVEQFSLPNMDDFRSLLQLNYEHLSNNYHMNYHNCSHNYYCHKNCHSCHMNHHCFLADQVLHHVEVEEVSCLLEVVGDHEAEMEDVQMEVGLVEVVANQVVVHLEN